MLVLNRKRNESIIVGENGEIKFTVLNMLNNCVKIGIEAPLEIPVHREEIYLRIKKIKAEIRKVTN
jgi:carbon storage regulator